MSQKYTAYVASRQESTIKFKKLLQLLRNHSLADYTYTFIYSVEIERVDIDNYLSSNALPIAFVDSIKS
jgi:hypothetical protein